MKSVVITGPGQVEVIEIPKPECGPDDVLVEIKATGICGSDHMYIQMNMPTADGRPAPLGHEPAGVVAEVGSNIDWITVGEHVVIDTMKFSDGLLGSGGFQGAFNQFVLVHEATEGAQLKVIPDSVPFTVACLNEPMAVALHGVNRTNPQTGEKVVIFGAGPIGLGAAISYRAAGISHIVVVDVLADRLEKALEVGADAVINSAEEDVSARLLELHGQAPRSFVRGARPDTDIYYDAAGVPAVIETVMANAKAGARLGIVAVHKKPVEINFGQILTTELTIALAMGYPTEIFEVTETIVADWEKYAVIVSDIFPHEKVLEALEFAGTPGKADKVVVSFEEISNPPAGAHWHG